MKLKKLLAGLMVFTLALSACSCASGRRKGNERSQSPESSKPETEVETEPMITDTTETSDETEPSAPYGDPDPTVTPGEPIEFTMFTEMTGYEINEDNEIRKLIAEKTGVTVRETYLKGQTGSEAISAIIASGKYPDYVYGSDVNELYKNNCLIAWDDYIDKYPNLKSLYTDEEWNKLRQKDGHIYWADVFNRYKGKDTSTTTSGQAFWIQVRVLEAYGYPKIETLDEYFDILEKYAKEHPELPNGTKVIPYTCICEDWRIFALEAAPMYLDGAPNNGCVIVNTDAGIKSPKVIDYNMSDTAKAYFKKLNEEYNKGIIDPDFDKMDYDKYIEKLSTGAVLGMCDQYWDFGYSLMGVFNTSQKGPNGSSIVPSDIGCDYVPLGLVAKKGMKQQWYATDKTINLGSGLAITNQCSNPDRAFKFLDDLLSQEIHNLRFWGVEGQDYLVDDEGLFYRTPDMRSQWNDQKYRAKHVCEYSYLTQWKGMSTDGINRMMPEQQPSEFLTTVPEPVAKCFKAYGVSNYVEMIGSDPKDTGAWYPLWSWSNSIAGNEPYAKAWVEMTKCKKTMLPEVVKAKNFDDAWKKYEAAYKDCNPEAFLKEAQAEVNRRMK